MNMKSIGLKLIKIKHIKRGAFVSPHRSFVLLAMLSNLVPPLNFTGLSWTGPLWRRRHQNDFLGQVKFRGGLNLTSTVRFLQFNSSSCLWDLKSKKHSFVGSKTFQQFFESPGCLGSFSLS